jgi:hypothetical protein
MKLYSVWEPDRVFSGNTSKEILESYRGATPFITGNMEQYAKFLSNQYAKYQNEDLPESIHGVVSGLIALGYWKILSK